MENFQLISPNATIGANVEIGVGVRIYDNVVIGANCTIADHCVIGAPTKHPRFSGKSVVVGAHATIRSHSVIYEGSSYGAGLETGHHVVLREGTVAGENLRVGNFSDVEGDCQIGDYCRFHGYAHIGKGSRIGDFVWIFSLVTLTNDPLPPSHLATPVTIEDGAVLAVGATPLPGSYIGMGAFIGAGSQVRGKIPPGAVVLDGKVAFGVHRLCSLEYGIAHPWMTHFKDAYPEDAWARLDQLSKDVTEASSKVK